MGGNIDGILTPVRRNQNSKESTVAQNAAIEDGILTPVRRNQNSRKSTVAQNAAIEDGILTPVRRNQNSRKSTVAQNAAIEDGILTPVRRNQNSKESTVAQNAATEVTEIELDKLIPYKNHLFQTYEGNRLEQLIDSIKNNGLLQPIVVRSIPERNGYFKTLMGHNRVEAMKQLDYSKISAIIKKDLFDEDAEQLAIESNLNQQSFSDWTYLQQILVIKRYHKYIQANSQQGRRNDLAENETCVQIGHKSTGKSKRLKARDKMAKQLGISPTAFERYRSLAKLDENTITTLCQMMDEKRISFSAAYRFSQLKPEEITAVVNLLEDNAEMKIKLKVASVLYKKSKGQEHDLTTEEIQDALSADGSGEI
ncbi:ParB N-terminal domain-containing protein [Lachnospiraceae bacterium ZAX-1]